MKKNMKNIKKRRKSLKFTSKMIYCIYVINKMKNYIFVFRMSPELLNSTCIFKAFVSVCGV